MVSREIDICTLDKQEDPGEQVTRNQGIVNMRVGSISVSLEGLSQGSESLVGHGTGEGNVVAGGLGDGQTVSQQPSRKTVKRTVRVRHRASRTVSELPCQSTELMLGCAEFSGLIKSKKDSCRSY